MKSHGRMLNFYRIELIFVSIFLFLMVLAGSHSGINLKNLETVLFLSISLLYFFTFAVLTAFVKVKSKKAKDVFRIISIILMILVFASIIFMVYRMITFNFDTGSAIPFLGFVLFAVMIGQTIYLVKKMIYVEK